MIGPPGVQELLLILFIVIVLFGAKRLPELGRGLGGALTSFRRGLRDDAPSGELPEERPKR